MKKSLSILAIFVFGFVLLTGQKNDNDGPRWSQISTAVYPDGKYVQLPSQPDRVVTFSNAPRYVYSPNGVLAVNPSVRVLPSTTWQQSELYLASNKVNRNIMFGSSNNVSGSSINSACFVTTNNGSTWGGWQQINSGNTNDQRGDPGPVVDKNLNFVFSHLVSATNFGGLTGMGANYSTNSGANFSSTFMLETSANVDKNLSGTDDSPTSPYYGYSYTAWCNLGTPAYSRFARTTNGGVTWDPMVTLATSSTNYYQGHDVAAGPNGEIYVISSYEGTASPWNAIGITFSKSTNGGVNFTTVNQAVTCNGARNNGTFGGWGLRVNDFPRIDVDKSGGARNGWIYMVNMQINLAPAGTDEDVILYRSSNQGTNWMPAVRVNQDALNNGKRQFFPAVKVDDFGGVNIIYYDNRNFPNADSATVMISRSIDGGATFTDFEITDHHFKPKPSNGMSGGYMGDYIGIAIGNNKVFGFWMDDKAGASGFYNAWAGSFDIGPAIEHTPLGNTEQTTGSRVVNCVITPAGSPITPSTVKLYYSLNNPTLTSNVTMTNSSGNNWTANLPMSGAGLYRYYITATDGLARTATYPGGAPANTVQFTATPDTVKPVITHTTLANTPKLNWPATVTASVTDNIGVDSVWVKWYKVPGTGVKQFKLNFASGTNYSAAFNSLNADVNIGDSIYYRVYARDNSSGHNADSTTLRSFKIINEATITIGTGTTAGNFPFTTYWMDGRTQYLFLASEINMAASLIKQIGFDVVSADPGPMNGYKVSFQNTTATTLTGYVTTGWTTSYAPASYTVPGTGWQMVTLTTPFLYAAGQNLLVEVCYNNSAYTQYSTVNTTTAPNMFWGRYGDLSTADGCATSTWTSTTAPVGRANTRMVFEPLVGVNPVGTTVPQVYSLSQNYPNPFNPVTKINFALPKQGFVTMKIYDVLGREVRTLVNEVKSAGSYSVDFNASEFSSGVYFYKLETEGFSDIKKMMLIK